MRPGFTFPGGIQLSFILAVLCILIGFTFTFFGARYPKVDHTHTAQGRAL